MMKDNVIELQNGGITTIFAFLGFFQFDRNLLYFQNHLFYDGKFTIIHQTTIQILHSKLDMYCWYQLCQ